MKTLIIKLKVDDDIEAYKAVNRLSFEFNILEAEYNQKVYKFNKTNKNKLPKHFLRDDFDKKI